MDELPTNLFSRANTLSSAAVRRLIKQVQQNNDQQAKRKLVEGNLRLVAKIAHRFKNNNYSLGDVFQVGIIGLLKAIKKFDREREVKFSTYAVPVIIGEIKMYLRADNPVKVGRTLKQKAQEIKQARRKLAQELNREPTIKDLSTRLDFSREEIVAALEADQRPASLDKEVRGGENLSLLDQLGTGEQQYTDKLKKLALNKGINKLNQREQKIFKLRFIKEKSQREIADKLDISQAHVSRLEQKVVQWLRQQVN